MRIAFLNTTHTDFNADTPLHAPLGGTESAACHLGAALAHLGHDVFILSNTSQPGRYRGVECLAWRPDEIWSVGNVTSPTADLLRSLKLDAAILLRVANRAPALRSVLGFTIPIILWAQDDHTQASARCLLEPAAHHAISAIAAVSHWQREQYYLHLGADLLRIRAVRNPLSQAFENVLDPHEPILPAKAWPPVLAYTSTPFRGLAVLLDIFPSIRARIPGTRLKVFSSMKVYQLAAAEDEKAYGKLYQRCMEIEGVEYVGSLPQPELAKQMKQVMALAYTNTFPETSCISAVEAMAAGCRVVTSNLGALPETTAGYAELLSLEQGEQAYKQAYVDRLVRTLEDCRENANGTVEQFLRRQIDYAVTGHSADLQARDWLQWLSKLVPVASPVASPAPPPPIAPPAPEKFETWSLGSWSLPK